MRGWKPAKRKDDPELPGLDGELVELKTAKAWGMTPHEWRRQSSDDRALMVAFEMFSDTCEGYRMEHREHLASGANDKKVSKGSNPYHAMLGQWGIPAPSEGPVKRERPE